MAGNWLCKSWVQDKASQSVCVCVLFQKSKPLFGLVACYKDDDDDMNKKWNKLTWLPRVPLRRRPGCSFSGHLPCWLFMTITGMTVITTDIQVSWRRRGGNISQLSTWPLLLLHNCVVFNKIHSRFLADLIFLFCFLCPLNRLSTFAIFARVFECCCEQWATSGRFIGQLAIATVATIVERE